MTEYTHHIEKDALPKEFFTIALSVRRASLHLSPNPLNFEQALCHAMALVRVEGPAQ